MKIAVHDPLTIALRRGEILYHRRKFAPSGITPQICWPKKTSSFLARCLHQSLLLYRLETKDDVRNVDFRPAEGHRFLTLQLDAGETLCFHYRNLVGFTADLGLSTYISLQLTTLCLDRIFFHLATGPGLVILEAKGVPEVFQDVEHHKAFPTKRLLCWSIDSEFAIEGSGGWLDIFMTPVFFRPLKSKATVIDADDPRIQSTSLLRAIARNIYLPGL